MRAYAAWRAALRTCVAGWPAGTAHPLSDVCRVSFIYRHLCSGDTAAGSAVACVSGASLSAEATDEEQTHHETAGCGHTTKKTVERGRDGETSVSRALGAAGTAARDRSVTTQRPGRFKIQKDSERHKCTTAVKLTWTPTLNRVRRALPQVLLPLGMAWLVISSETLLVFCKISTDRVLSR